MKPRVLARDFDGTAAVGDTIHADVAAAVRDARGAGLMVVLVPGRILSNVEGRCTGKPPFDAIVAENGAVLKISDLRSAVTRRQKVDRRGGFRRWIEDVFGDGEARYRTPDPRG